MKTSPFDKLTRFWNSAGETYSLWSADMYLLDLNQHYIDTFHPGLTKDQVIGKHLHELMPGLDQTPRYNRYLKVLSEKKPTKWQEKVSRDGFEDRYMYINVFPIDDDFGVITSDVTELVKTQKNLEQIDNRYRILYNHTPVMMHSIDTQGIITDVNEYWLEVLQYQRKEVIGRGIVEFMTPESRQIAVKESLPNFFATGITKNREYRIVKKNGDIMDVMLSAIGLFGKTQQIENTLAFMIDVTERKKYESQQKNLIRELQTKNAELEKFTYSVSHDLKSPLVTIQGFLSLLKQEFSETATSQMLSDFQRISNAAEKMGQLLDELLDISRVSRTTSTSQQVDMNQIVVDIQALLHGAIVEKNAKIKVQSNLPTVVGDPVRLREVIQNLIENAIKYSIPKKEIEIEVGWHPSNPQNPDLSEDVIFWVKDNGIGIEPRFHKKIFDLFEKLDQHNTGTGIGLALCHKIIEIHGGSIWVESAGIGKGTTFFFSLPKSHIHAN
ncbi:MAG: ATP-binding protein [Bacteroidia bacterium]